MFDATWASVAVNVFATLIVTPVLLFGVDQTLERVEQRRRAPQHVAIRRTFRSALGQTVNIVSGAAFEERAAMLLAPAFQRNEDINEVMALYVVEHPDEVSAGIAKRDLDALRRMVGDLRELEPQFDRALLLAEGALTAEQVALGVSIVTAISQTARLLELVELTSKNTGLVGKAVHEGARERMVERLLESVVPAASAYHAMGDAPHHGEH
jgi:hypothetical protein